MTKSRELAIPPTWTTPSQETESNGVARTIEEQITLYHHEHAPALKRYLLLRGYTDEQAEDATQEAFLKLYCVLRQGGRVENPPAWVRVVSRHSLNSSYRKKRVEEARHAELLRAFREAGRKNVTCPERLLIERQWAEALQRAMDQLPPEQRRCLLLRMSGLKLKEISEIEQLDFRRVSQLVHTALERLHRDLYGSR